MHTPDKALNYKVSNHFRFFFVYLLLSVGAVIMLMPFFWMLSTSLKAPNEVTIRAIRWIPEVFQWSNFPRAWEAAPFKTYFFNSFTISISTTFIEVIFSALAAYAFAKMQFFGKNILFLIFLGTMMVPGEVMLIPNYLTMVSFGWIDTYWALIVPWTVSVFSIFLLRQFFMSIPHDLYEAAVLDGCGRFRFLVTILLPLSKPALITVMLFKFIGSWNAFLWVLIMTNSPRLRTVPVGLSYFVTDVGTQYNLLMAASTFAMAPIIVLFLLLQKQFIQGIARSGMKG